MAEQIKVFVSSDMTELAHEREIAETTINELSLRALLFEFLPALSRSPVAAYIAEVQQCHIFVMLLWKTFPNAVRSEYEEAVARAKPILIFVKDLEDTDKHRPELARFLKSLRGGEDAGFAIRTTYRTFRKLSELSKALREALAEEIAKFYEKPQISATRTQLYDLGTSIIKNAQKRLYLVQRTPALFLGARDYLAPNQEKKHFEKRFLDELTKWIKDARNDPKRTLLYVFSVSVGRCEAHC
jgi:hypothetical protein